MADQLDVSDDKQNNCRRYDSGKIEIPYDHHDIKVYSGVDISLAQKVFEAEKDFEGRIFDLTKKNYKKPEVTGISVIPNDYNNKAIFVNIQTLTTRSKYELVETPSEVLALKISSNDGDYQISFSPFIQPQSEKFISFNIGDKQRVLKFRDIDGNATKPETIKAEFADIMKEVEEARKLHDLLLNAPATPSSPARLSTPQAPSTPQINQ